jgi:hypothetical protein
MYRRRPEIPYSYQNVMCYMVKAIALKGVITDEYRAMVEESQKGKPEGTRGKKPGVRSFTANLTLCQSTGTEYEVSL